MNKLLQNCLKTRQDNLLQKFLSEEDYEESGNSKTSVDLNNLSSDDEVWLLQCPKSINITLVAGKKLKLPGKTNFDLIETTGEEHLNSEDKLIVSTKDRSGKYYLQQVQYAGTIELRHRLKSVQKAEINSNSAVKVPFPENLKERHPLHGAKFIDKVTIKSEVIDRLKQANEPSEKNSSIKEESLNTYDTKKGRKRKNQENNMNVNKILKVSNLKQEDTDLDWIKDI